MVKASKAPATGRAKTNPSVPTIVGGEQPLVAPQVQEMVAAPTVSLTLQTPATGQPTPTAAQQPAPTQTQPYPLLTVASRQSFVIPLADTLTPKLHAARTKINTSKVSFFTAASSEGLSRHDPGAPPAPRGWHLPSHLHRGKWVASRVKSVLLRARPLPGESSVCFRANPFLPEVYRSSETMELIAPIPGPLEQIVPSMHGVDA